MTDDLDQTEQLLQRFVDQELSAEERIQFVVALGRDAALRARALDLERLALNASRLPRPTVPDGFAARVIEQVASAETPRRRPIAERIARVLSAPRTLQWNLGTALAAACVMLLAAGGATQLRRGEPAPSAPSPAATRQDDPPVVLVRLVVVQPGARIVQAAGDFNGWNPAQTPLEQTADGAWTVTLPLEPGRYEYQFVVDGRQWIGDPFAAEQNADGFGSRNAVLDVRPPETL